MSIVFEQVTYAYPSSQDLALKGVSFSVEKGEFFGIIGHTGSGKSTLIQHINGLLVPTSGRVCVDGLELASDKTARKAVKRKVGIVFQYPEYQLFADTVMDDVAFGPRNAGIPEAEVRELVAAALKRVGLDPQAVLEKSPFDFSGGQRRRIALAGMLAMQPEILVLDEPMAGLDPRGRKNIMAFIESLHAEGMTIIMVSHNMADVAAHADHILVLKEGEVFLCDTPEEVFSHPVELRAIGLGVPIETKLAAGLIAGGLPVPPVILTFDALVDAIAEAFGMGGEAL